MLDPKVLFRARQSNDDSATTTTAKDSPVTSTNSLYSSKQQSIASLISTPNTHQTNSEIIELTKNTKYCVSKLPASPSVLSDTGSNVLNGYSDNFSNYAIVVNENTINVWNYKSTDPTPLSIQFPLQETESLPPLAILTRPINTTTDDPGLVIIDSTSGHVKFYESVQHAPTLGLINNKSLELTVPLDTSRGEFITLAENVEPAGIVIATSLKRCVLLGFRDYFSKPKLTLTELLAPSTGGFAGRLFNKFFSGGKTALQSPASFDDEIVSIKTTRVIDQGMSQEILIQDSNGEFNFLNLQLVTPVNGSGAMIDAKLSYRQYILSCIENNIEGYNLPGSSNKIKILDLWPLQQKSLKDVYLVLCEIDSAIQTKQDSNTTGEYFLVTLKINRTGALYYGTSKLNNSYFTPSTKPRLYLPEPSTTAFVLIGNSVVLTDVNLSYIGDSSTTEYYFRQRRWEDIIRLKSSVQIIGQGYEDESATSNASLVLLTDNSGVLRVEKFKEDASTTPEADSMDIDDDIETHNSSPISIVKSHIEQGIFFAGNSEIELDLLIPTEGNRDVDVGKSYSDKVVKMAVLQIIDEILSSSSRYLPVFLPSIRDYLSLKITLYRELISYVKRNFPEIWNIIVPNIVERLQKVSAGLQLWTTVENAGAKIQNLLKDAIRKHVTTTNNSDLIRYFLNDKLQYINEVLSEFIGSLVSEGVSLTFINDLLVNTLYFGVFKFEEEYILNESEIEVRKLWIFDTDLIIKFEEIFQKIYCETGRTDPEENSIVTEKTKTSNVQLCEALYYFVTSAVQYMQNFDATNRQQLKEYLKWYRSSKAHWINSLISRSLYSDAIIICEKYHDLSSLVEVLEARKLGSSTMSSSEKLNISAYDEYFEKFGYDFASNLYDYYLKKDQLKELILGYENYRNYLTRYFDENPAKTSQISWIRDLLDGKYVKGARTLTSSSQNPDDRIENKQLKLSLAKLSVLAGDGGKVGSSEELLTEANNNLILIRIQKKLFQELSKGVSGEGDLLTLDYVTKNFQNDAIDPHVFKAIIKDPLRKLSTRKSLNSLELITLLTLLKPSLNSGKNFAYALRIASLITNESSFQSQCKLIWLRLLTLTDDWESLTNTENQTDESVKWRVNSSNLFKTLLLIGVENELIQHLNEILEVENFLATTVFDDNFSNDLLTKLNSLVVDKNLSTWVNSIKSQVSSSKS